MTMRRIPFVPLPLEKAVKVSKLFIGLADKLIKFFPKLNNILMQASIELRDKEYISVAIFTAVFWFFLGILIFTPLALFIKMSFLKIGIFISATFFILSFLYVILYPNLIVTKKNKLIERNLLFALRHLLIQVKSGVTLFEAMVSISKGNYGMVSEEFAKCTKSIATGTPEVDAINEMAVKNPNLHFRRVLWQLANSMRAGADIGNALTAIVQNLSEDQNTAIRKYGSQLNPLALLYMMFSIIIPSLGITFLFIITSFVGFPITKTVFYIILFMLTVLQFMFVGLIKSRRPAIEV
ncbi:MAG: type II secretion system F family protein [Candidatus Aenigmatarchaeota archaeon]